MKEVYYEIVVKGIKEITEINSKDVEIFNKAKKMREEGKNVEFIKLSMGDIRFLDIIAVLEKVINYG